VAQCVIAPVDQLGLDPAAQAVVARFAGPRPHVSTHRPRRDVLRAGGLWRQADRTTVEPMDLDVMQDREASCGRGARRSVDDLEVLAVVAEHGEPSPRDPSSPGRASIAVTDDPGPHRRSLSGPAHLAGKSGSRAVAVPVAVDGSASPTPAPWLHRPVTCAFAPETTRGLAESRRAIGRGMQYGAPTRPTSPSPYWAKMSR
jgi:hypothetical protein